ncbi:MAG: carbon starvation protein A, partial [bacterium]
TTSKQINIETDAKAVGYGSMLIEAVLAVIAMITAVTILQGDYRHLITAQGGGPIGIFSNGMGGFISKLGIPVEVGITFAALAISAFALTTMDTATRIGRFAFQEFFEKETKLTFLSQNRYVGTLVTVASAAFLAFSGTGNTLWPLFGAANQFLAAIVLLAVTVWLTNLKVKNSFVKYPMIFMSFVTLFALINLIYKNLIAKNFVLSIIAILLFIVGIFLFVQAIKQLQGKTAK